MLFFRAAVHNFFLDQLAPKCMCILSRVQLVRVLVCTVEVRS